MVSLLVTPTAIYCFTFTKPDEEEFGLDMKVEKTADPAMMEWVLHEYIGDFIRDYNNVTKEALEATLFDLEGPIEPVNPVDWTSINLKNVSTFVRSPNLGFLFTTTGEL